MTTGAAEPSQYELKRQQLIEENQKLLQELGLSGPGNLIPDEAKKFKIHRHRVKDREPVTGQPNPYCSQCAYRDD
ncbi:hypothetical protein BJV82DRAFT_51251 [Fennellomyces sp. T-0311]|nr:hypothetical protein BJV82DRAFT_51251 [Fennellomyces sp. T-0311]